jgi:uncharacterized protein (TIGR00369 family)
MTDLSEQQAHLRTAGWKPTRSAGAFMALAGPLWARQEGEAWAYGVLAAAQHLNPAGVVHGGLLASLMDHALSAIAWEAADRAPCVTLQLDTHFLSPALPGELIEARGQVLRRSAGLVFLRGGLNVGERSVLAAQALMKIQAKQPL